jgi:hypothetical protein
MNIFGEDFGSCLLGKGNCALDLMDFTNTGDSKANEDKASPCPQEAPGQQKPGHRGEGKVRFSGPRDVGVSVRVNREVILELLWE